MLAGCPLKADRGLQLVRSIIGVFIIGSLVPITQASGPSDPPQTLRETGLYADSNSETIHPHNRIFEPQFPLWSDGAQKDRWIYLPPHTQINSQNLNDWIFPIGTKFWKEFSFRSPEGLRRKVETRFLEKRNNGWTAATYLWNSDQTEAKLAPEEGIEDFYEFAPGKKYSIPAKSSCLTCHAGGRDLPLGFGALQLSDPQSYRRFVELPDGRLDLNQLVTESLLSHPPIHIPRIPSSDSHTVFSFGYFFGNCMSCHRARGFAGFTGLLTDIDVNQTDLRQLNLYRSAIGRRSNFQIPGFERRSLRIAPGDLQRSSLYYRMESETPGTIMPSLGRKYRDEEGLKQIRNWILNLSENSAHQ